ncbi:glutamine synthetase [Populus alba x Populus x berolinensis]|uniref:Glutamine synthetase n=1 Tax=Populus alba x Populus x berolinensis TaxID=444605 RepID=A0AAD6LFV7_9ROSI|nr:glutamine synthetase [Populus alba x Populus x berolinensis]
MVAQQAAFHVCRNTKKEGKGCFEDRSHASNMDPYVATSMIAETTILRMPREHQPTPHMKYCF